MKESNEKYVDMSSSSSVVRKQSRERVGDKSDRNMGKVQGGRNFEIAEANAND